MPDKIFDFLMSWAQAHPLEAALLAVPVLLMGWPVLLWAKGKWAEAEERGKARGKHLGERDVGALSPTPAPATADEIAQAVAAHLRNDDSLVAGIAAKLNTPGEKPITDQAVATFLRTLGEEAGPEAELPAKLDSIAASHRSLLQELAVLRPANPDATALVTQAAEAAESGDRTRVDQLLAEAGALEDGDIDRLESVLDERRKNAARIEVERARNALAGLDHETAAHHFEAAADKLGTTEPRWRAILLDEAAREWLVLGQAKRAAEQISRTHQIMTGLAVSAPHDTDAQRDLSVSHNKMGDVLLKLGNTTEALKHYRSSISIRQILADRNPNDIETLRDLSVSHNRMGDILACHGDSTKAMEHYRADIGITQTLVKLDPNSTQAQRDLSISHNRIGDILENLGDTTEALEHYLADLHIAQNLADLAPSNAQAQRDLSVSHERMGDILAGRGEHAQALVHYHDAHKIRNILADLDPGDVQAQIDLTMSHERLSVFEPDRAINHAEAMAIICRSLRLRGAWHQHLDWLEQWSADILAGVEPGGAENKT